MIAFLAPLLASAAARRALELAGVGLVVVGLLLLVRHEHASAVSARHALAASQAQVAAVTASAAANQTALENTAAAAEARARQLGTIRNRINETIETHACAGSPAMRALLDGLRERAGSQTAPGARVTADVHR